MTDHATGDRAVEGSGGLKATAKVDHDWWFTGEAYCRKFKRQSFSTTGY